MGDNHDDSSSHHAHGHGHAHGPVHGHDHGHAHGHVHGAGKHGAAFAVGISLNLTFVVVETIYGLVSHSMALVADAGHNLSDVLGLALAWGASVLAQRAPTKRRTYGYRSTTILAALGNAVVLVLVTGGLAWESIRRLSDPPSVASKTVIVVALIGVLINGLSALLFAAGSKGDLNIRGAFLHLMADAAVSFGVAGAGAIMWLTGWRRLDPVVSLLLALFILGSTWSLLKKAFNLAVNGVPEGIDPDAVEDYLVSLPQVKKVHDLHIWAMSTSETALTAHLVTDTGSCDPGFLAMVSEALHERFAIAHATLQVETESLAETCRLAGEGTL